MKVKSITASSIHAALMEARRQFGDGIVLLESVAPEGDAPARVTVMTDAPRQADFAKTARSGETASASADPVKAAAHNTRETASARAAHHARESAPATASIGGRENASRLYAHEAGGPAESLGGRSERRDRFGYHALEAAGAPALAAEEYAPAGELVSGQVGGRPIAQNGEAPAFDTFRRTKQDFPSGGDASAPPEPHRRNLSGRGQLFPRKYTAPHAAGDPPAAGADAVEQLLHAQLQLLHDRLDKMEYQFGGAIIGAAQAWASNPLFGDLLNAGFRPSTATRLFDALASKGFQPDADAETLKWAMAQEIRRSVATNTIRDAHCAQVFIGPSGSGKTSMVLKAAKHPEFYGRRNTAVIVIEPEHADRVFHNSPVELFRRHGLPVQSVSSVEEMHEAVLRVQQFDHILIDTPSFPLQPNAARKALRHVQRLVTPIVPLRVQMVMNATRSLDDFDPDTVRGLSLRPEALALTHMDELNRWGRVADWLMTLKMPVQFVSTSDEIPDGVISFSPSWFVEEMMKL